MLKWIFGLLLLVNILFFALMHWGGALMADAGNPPVQPELNPDKVKLLALDVPASAVLAASAVAVAEVQPASQPVAAPVAPAPAVLAPAVTPPAAVAPPRTPAPAVAAAPAHPVTPAAPKSAPQAKPVAPVASVKTVCLEWGEFAGNSLAQAEKALEPLHLDKHVKARTSEHGTAFWVYIPPIKNHANLMKKVEQLKTLGVQDHFIVQEAGPWQNAISLGVFKSKDAAQGYLASVRGKGVKSAKLGKRSNKLKVTVFEFSKLDSATAARISELGKTFPDEELKQVNCGE